MHLRVNLVKRVEHISSLFGWAKARLIKRKFTEMELITGFNKVIVLMLMLMLLRKTTAYSEEYDKKCYDKCFRSCVDQGNIPWQCSSHCMDACSNDLDVIRYCNVGCLLQNCNKIMDGNTNPFSCLYNSLENLDIRLVLAW
ncbi:hypothetical protein NC653_007018 [Populus alba x Populus x berolinensis]|uniref:Uncharacterized protein n=2 Tax=Populus alba x Populus x berolinensis TaxID=444605 RepID=A0AAD6RGV1_9ROSI|nr:hypothetical protein NC653_007018 [Populus alba x Populus x berolinensis]